MRIHVSTSCFLLLLVGAFLVSNAQRDFSFSDFEYPEESVIYGSQNRTTYFIPINALILEDTGNRLILKLQTSAVLDPKNSFVTIAIGDVPVATKSTPINGRGVLEFDIKLEKRYIKSGFFKIDIITDLSINDETCEIYSEGAYWVNRLPSSQIALNYNEEKKVKILPADISEFLPIVNKILIPSKPNFKTLAHAAYIKFFFSRTFNQELTISKIEGLKPDNLDRAIVLGVWGELPSSLVSDPRFSALGKEQGLILLNSNGNSRNLVVTGKNSAGFEKAARTMLNANLLKSAFTDRIVVEQPPELLRTAGLREYEEVTFKELGAEDEIMEGIGKLSKDIALPRSIYGGDLNRLQVNLKFNYRPVQETEDAYVNLYLDGVLKHSEALDLTGTYSSQIELGNFAMEKSNTLKVEIYYVPAGGLCVSNAPMFYSQIDLHQSYFKAISYNDNPDLNFFYFPENFQRKETKFYISPTDTESQLASVAELIDVFNPRGSKNQRLTFPRISSLESFDMESEDNKIIITRDLTPFKKFLEENAYLDIDNQSYTFHNEDYSNFFQGTYSNEIGFNQLFNYGGTSVMFLYNPKGNPQTLAHLITGMESQNIKNTGNLILANPDKSYFFDLMKEEDTLSQEDLEIGFNGYWSKYGIFLVFAIFILMMVILIYIFQKSQQAKSNIVDEN